MLGDGSTSDLLMVSVINTVDKVTGGSLVVNGTVFYDILGHEGYRLL